MFANSEILGVEGSDSPFIRKHLRAHAAVLLHQVEKRKTQIIFTQFLLFRTRRRCSRTLSFGSLAFRWIPSRKILPTDDQDMPHASPIVLKLMLVFLLSWKTSDLTSARISPLKTIFILPRFALKMLDTVVRLKKCLLSLFLYTTLNSHPWLTRIHNFETSR